MSMYWPTDERGVTLVELIVTLAVSSLMLVFVVSGSLFVRNYLQTWKQRDMVAEELAFVLAELSPGIQTSRSLQVSPGRLVIVSRLGDSTKYHWQDDQLHHNDKPLIRIGLHLDYLSLTQLKRVSDTTSSSRSSVPTRGLYELTLIVSDENNNCDTLYTIVRNDYEFLKYYP